MNLESEIDTLLKRLDHMEKVPRQLVNNSQISVLAAAKGLVGYQHAELNSHQTTSSTSYTDLATVGPQVNFTVGESGRFLVMIQATVNINTPGGSGGPYNYGGGCTFSYDGVTPDGTPVSLAASDDRAFMSALNFTLGGIAAIASAGRIVLCEEEPYSVLNVCMKYRATGGTISYGARRLIVMPF